MAAYVFAKVKFRGRDLLFYLYFIGVLHPLRPADPGCSVSRGGMHTPVLSTLDGRTYPTLPEEAVQTDEMGITYIYIIESTDEYPESEYKAVRKDVTMVQCTDGTAYFLSGVFAAEKIVLRWEGTLEDGGRVLVE